jgi:glyceraldehyde-3-phosphate dehydrogenase/erythrose-4-phosphate dehydrogenase
VIGAGRIGKIHAENLVTRILDVEVVAIADLILPAAKETVWRLRLPVEIRMAAKKSYLEKRPVLLSEVG